MDVTVLCPGPINTNIARGARNRADHMGGPQIRPSDEAILAERLAATALDPKRVGKRVGARSAYRRSMPLSAPFPPT